MSRKELKLSAKKQIKGNIIVLFFMGLIANVAIWFNSIQNAVLSYSGLVSKYVSGMLLGLTKTYQPTPQFYTNLFALLGIFATTSTIMVILIYVLGSPLRISLSHTYLEMASEEKNPEFGMLGFGFKKCWLQSILLNFLSGLFVALWSLLLIVPGIIKAFSYSMANYIMAENPEIKALDAITKSRKLMNGHKFELFVLGLSFFLWYMLVAITFGIAIIYVGPYMEATTANFYLKIKNSNAEEV